MEHKFQIETLEVLPRRTCCIHKPHSIKEIASSSRKTRGLQFASVLVVRSWETL